MKYYRKRIRRLFLGLFILFLVMNIMAIFHAYRFTHFVPGGGKKPTHIELSFTQKVAALLTGIKNPRPEDTLQPLVPYRNVVLQSNKQIGCWLINTDSAPAKGTILILHGYRGSKSAMLDKAAEFRQMGYHVMLPDFMGSGSSEGNVTTVGYDEAAQVKSCVDYLSAQGEKHIILFGTSMGAAAAMKALHDYQLPVQAAILECPFGTMYQTVANRFKVMGVPPFPMAGLLVFWGGTINGFNGFAHNPETYAGSIKCPTLLLWGEKDKFVSKAETQAIYTNLSGPKQLITYPLAGHENYLHRYQKEWLQDVGSFLEKYGG